jgi:hypothetical protein
MQEKVIISASTLTFSLVTYLYAKHAEKDAIPYVMIGGFVGGLIGELIAGAVNDNNNTPQGGAVTG